LKQSKLWPKGTLCISIAANIGFTAILSFDACFPDSVVGFVTGKKVIIEYTHFYFRFVQKQLEENAPQAAQKNINLAILGNLKVPLPPQSLQQQFAEIVNKTETLKEKQKQSEQELENLFQSLMQKAFKGELVT
jgi:type I restriction enzyme S subunit